MGTLHVLIVEDSPDDATLMALELRRSGFEPAVQRVETAEQMSRALDRQAWDLILADYKMPHFSAPRALALVQERELDIPFIVVSGQVGEEKAVAAMKAGAHDFVLKQSLFRLGAAVARELREAEERRQRRKAEAALMLLADVTRLLTEAADYRTVLRRAVELTVPSLADWCILYSSGEHASLDIVDVAHGEAVDGAALRALADGLRPRDLPAPEDRGPIADALRTRRAVLVREITDEVMTRISPAPAHRELLVALRLRSMIALPLLVRERLTGVWVFAATGSRRYTDEDLSLAQEIGGRIALVAENARLQRAREEFVATAVHEIKTPIAVIKLAVQLMKELPADRTCAEIPRFLTRVDRQCNRLTRLVTNVLEASRLELESAPLTRSTADLSVLVAAVVRDMAGAAAHRIVITENTPMTLEIDVDRIEQVLINVIDNAIRYSPGGSVIEVASRHGGDEAVVSVRDHGVGIPTSRQARIFELFYRAHAGTPSDHAASLGVGLYLSRELVARHGGRMWFESREGEGSTFYFSLPLTRRQIAAPSEEGAP